MLYLQLNYNQLCEKASAQLDMEMNDPEWKPDVGHSVE